MDLRQIVQRNARFFNAPALVDSRQRRLWRASQVDEAHRVGLVAHLLDPVEPDVVHLVLDLVHEFAQVTVCGEDVLVGPDGALDEHEFLGIVDLLEFLDFRHERDILERVRVLMRILVEVVEDVDAVLVLETRPGVNGLVDHLAFISVVCFNLGEELGLSRSDIALDENNLCF